MVPFVINNYLPDYNISEGPREPIRSEFDGLLLGEAPMFVTPFDFPLSDPRHPFHVAHMKMAIDEARIAADEDEVPIGCVIVSREKGVIARAHNQRETLNDPTGHAEMIAITQAAAALGSWRLENCILYVTLEPCPMCAGAIVLARLAMVVYGALDPKAGACESLYRITNDARLNHRAQSVSGVLAEQCSGLLSDFFAAQRKRRKGESGGLNGS